MVMPRRNHQTESLERWNKELGEAKGTTLPERMLAGKPRSWKIVMRPLFSTRRRHDLMPALRRMVIIGHQLVKAD